MAATKERPSTTWVAKAENKHVSDAHLDLLDKHDYFHASTNPHHLSAQEVWQRIDFMKVSEKTP